MKLSVSLVALLGAVDGAMVRDSIPIFSRHQANADVHDTAMMATAKFNAPSAVNMQAAQQDIMQHSKMAHPEFPEINEPVNVHDNLNGIEVLAHVPGFGTIESPNPDVSATAFTTNQFSPQGVLTCNIGEPIQTTQCMTTQMYEEVTSAVQAFHAGLGQQSGGTAQADFAGCILRMAGHDLMDFMPGSPNIQENGQSVPTTGGSDGCIDFLDGDNAGLHSCLQELSAAYNFMQGTAFNSVDGGVCQRVSLADFLVIAGEAVMEVTNELPANQDIGFKNNFKWGRTTSGTCAWANHRLPNPENGCKEGNPVGLPGTTFSTNLPGGGSSVKTNFVDALGLTWKEAGTLMGVHTLGRTDPANSGYDGWWSTPGQQGIFNNDFYKSLIARGWKGTKAKIPNSPTGALNPNKNQWEWVGTGSSVQDGMDQKVIMLNSDMCLFYSDSSVTAPSAQGCCGWNIHQGMGSAPAVTFPHCGSNNPNTVGFPQAGNPENDFENCCGVSSGLGGCVDISNPGGPGVDVANSAGLPDHIRQLASDNGGNAFFYSEFKTVWSKVTTNGFSIQQNNLENSCANTQPPTPTKAPTKAPTKVSLPPTAFPTKPPTTDSDSSSCWTPWFNSDTPSGSGDWETLEKLAKTHPQHFINAGCNFDIYSNTVEAPKGVQCAESYSGRNISVFNDDFTNGIKCTPEEGLVCLTSDQTYGTCQNYKIRFNCCAEASPSNRDLTTLTFQDENEEECKMRMDNGKLVATCPIESPTAANFAPTLLSQRLDGLEKRLAAIEGNQGMSSTQRDL